jgi:hypothetical protein
LFSSIEEQEGTLSDDIFGLGLNINKIIIVVINPIATVLGKRRIMTSSQLPHMVDHCVQFVLWF